MAHIATKSAAFKHFDSPSHVHNIMTIAIRVRFYHCGTTYNSSVPAQKHPSPPTIFPSTLEG